MVSVDVEGIKRVIAESEKTQAQVARDSGLSPAHLWLIVNQQRRLTATNYARICKALNVSMTSFLIDK